MIFIDFEPREFQMDSHKILQTHRFFKRFSLISSLENGKWIRIASYNKKTIFFNDFHWSRASGLVNGFAQHLIQNHSCSNDGHWFRASGVVNGSAWHLTNTSIFKRLWLISSLGRGKWICITSYKNIEFQMIFIDFELREWWMDSHAVLPEHRFLNDFYWFRASGVTNGFAY